MDGSSGALVRVGNAAEKKGGYRYMDDRAIVAIVIFALYLLWQKWFWILASWLGGIASFFAMLASVFNFQILWAMGFFSLALFCGGIAVVIAEADEASQKNNLTDSEYEKMTFRLLSKK